MVDTMGENLEYLSAALAQKYPQTTFKLYNYGIGSQNVEDGLARFNSNFTYKDRNFPPISQLKPDVVVLSSFSYNPFFPYVRDRHWLGLTALIKKAQEAGSRFYLLCEIAPLQSGFGKGPGGVNWPEADANEQARKITEQLENCSNLSVSLNVPVIDAFHRSVISGNYGNPAYVATHDGIHPSVAGHQLMAKLIVDTVKLP